MNINKVALITGITGQDGSYLAELLLEKYNSQFYSLHYFISVYDVFFPLIDAI